jgi:putative transposase
MPKISRRVTLRIYPTAKQAARLESVSERHRILYNAALEHRITAYRRAGVTITKGEQEKQVTLIRAEDPDYGALNAQSLQVTLDRLHKAFKGFFGRVKRGEKAGFPRFKSRSRWKGFGFKSHGDGWKLFAGEFEEGGKQKRSGRIRITGVGLVRVRGRARLPGRPKTCDLTKQNGKWYASVVLECEPHREHGEGACAFDWGIDTFLTIATDTGRLIEVDNPRHDRSAEKKTTELRRTLARKKRGSKSRAKAKAELVRHLEKVANRRHDFLHKQSTRLVGQFGIVATENLEVAKMTRSAKGTVQEPGTNVKQKAGLNRSILDGAPATFVSMVSSKAEEAGAKYIEAKTRELAPTQRCHACWKKPSQRKQLSDRVHSCEHCGATCGRDENAALVLMRWVREELDVAGPAGDRAGAGEAAREGGQTAETPGRAA